MHISRTLGIGWVFTTASFVPFGKFQGLQLKDLRHAKSSAQGRIRQVGLALGEGVMRLKSPTAPRPSLRDLSLHAATPNAEALGYSHPSLRDAKEMRIPMAFPVTGRFKRDHLRSKLVPFDGS